MPVVMLTMDSTGFTCKIRLGAISKLNQHIVEIICTEYHGFITMWSVRLFFDTYRQDYKTRSVVGLADRAMYISNKVHIIVLF